MNSVRRTVVLAVALAGVVAPIGATVLPAAAAGPTVTRTVTVEMFDDDFIFELCGVATVTTMNEKVTLQEWPDGTAMRHVVVTFTPEDPRVAIERNARTERYDADGTITITGLAIRLVDQTTGRAVIRDRGRLTASPDGSIVFTGPHPFIELEDQAPVYCPGL